MRALADSIGVLACLAGARQQPLLAARLFGAAEVSREASGAVIIPWLAPVFSAGIERTRAALGQVSFDVAWAEGRATALEEVVRMALAEDEPEPAAEATPAAPPAPEDAELQALTAREREVAALIARGLTSAEIAAELIVSERTIDAHADHIRAKLSLRSRAEIAAWATAHGLRPAR
jgi:DNA-binding CsgD family transcriptional regulator